jgi:hypothetical protein
MTATERQPAHVGGVLGWRPSGLYSPPAGMLLLLCTSARAERSPAPQALGLWRGVALSANPAPGGPRRAAPVGSGVWYAAVAFLT